MDAFATLWGQLSEHTRAWLVVNNGDAVPEHMIDDILGPEADPAESEWFTRDGGGWRLVDAAIDWIDEFANGEHQA